MNEPNFSIYVQISVGFTKNDLQYYGGICSGDEGIFKALLRNLVLEEFFFL